MAIRRVSTNSENIEFCARLRALSRKHSISLRAIGDTVSRAGFPLSKSQADRVLNGAVSDYTVSQVRRILSAELPEMLVSRGLTAEAVKSELSNLFSQEDLSEMLDSRVCLSPEAVRFFRLTRDPFDVDRLPGEEEIFTWPDLDNVVSLIRDAVLYHRFIAVVGGVGSGKTLVKLRVAAELDDLGKSRLIYPEFFAQDEVSVSSIAAQILIALDQPVPREKTRRVGRIREILTEYQQEGIAVAIVLDECHRLNDRVVSSLKNFWELTNGRSSRLLGVLLFGQPVFAESRLRDSRFREIRQRVQVVPMPGLGNQAAAYLSRRIAAAGGDLASLFEPAAIQRISANADTPLAIGNLINGSLMAAFREQESVVSASLPFFRDLPAAPRAVVVRRAA